MKKLLLIVICILFPSISLANNRSNWKLSASAYQTIPSSSEDVVQSGSGLQALLYYKSTYIYLSRDRIPIRFGGQRGTDIDVWSLGIGFERKLTDRLIMFCDAGWYEPQFRQDGELLKLWGTEHLAEGLNIYLNNKLASASSLGYYEWDAYSLEYSGSIGGRIGLCFEQPISEHFIFGLSIGYQYLRFSEMVKGKDHNNDRGWWEYKHDRDFSNYQMGLKLTWIF